MQAESAIQEAQAAGADEYAPDAFKSSAEAMADARSKNERKDFDGAHAAAVDARVKAELAQALISEGRALARDEVIKRLALQLEAWEAVDLALSKVKLPVVEMGKMSDLTSDIESLLSEARQLIEATDYISGLATTKKVEEKIEQVRTTLESRGARK